MIRPGNVGAPGPWAAVSIGLSAHATAAGALPAVVPTLLVLPLMLMTVRAVDHHLSRFALAARAAAGQAVVHAALTLANPYASAPGGYEQGHVLPALDVVMTGAHVAALVGCVTVAAQVERSICAILGNVADWIRAVAAPGPGVHLAGARRGPVEQDRAGFVPTQLMHRACGITRGPPRLYGCPATA